MAEHVVSIPSLGILEIRPRGQPHIWDIKSLSLALVLVHESAICGAIC